MNDQSGSRTYESGLNAVKMIHLNGSRSVVERYFPRLGCRHSTENLQLDESTILKNIDRAIIVIII